MSEDPVRFRILEEATRLFGERGFGSTSIRDVAAAAGVTNPTIYYHFKSKEGLYLEAIRSHVAEFHARLEAAIRGPGPVAPRLRAWIAEILTITAEDRDAARLLMYANNRPRAGEPQVDMMSMHLATDELLFGLIREGKAEGIIRADIEPASASVALSGMTILACYAVFCEMPVPEDAPDRILDLLLRGIGA